MTLRRFIEASCSLLAAVARFGIVSFPNAGHWQNRWRALAGRGAGTELASGLPLARSITLAQFRAAAARQGVEIKALLHWAGARRIRLWPSLRARTTIGLLGRRR